MATKPLDEQLCMYYLLDELVRSLEADTAALVGWSPERPLTLLAESNPNAGPGWFDLLGSKQVSEVIEGFCREATHPVGAGARHSLLMGQIWLAGQAYRSDAEVFVVAVYHPRRDDPEPTGTMGEVWSQRFFDQISGWLAHTSYQHLMMRRSCLKDAHNARDGTEFWPGASLKWLLTFSDFVYFIEHEAQMDKRETKASKAATACLTKLHLDARTSCQWGSVHRCRFVPGRDRLVHLARLIPLRLLRAEHGQLAPWEADGTDLDDLLSVQQYFLPKMRMTSLNNKGLLRWFAANFWKEWLGAGRQRALLAAGKKGNPAQQAKLLSTCTRLAHYVLEPMPTDSRTVEDLIWAVARYAHETLGVDARLDIGSHLLRAARNEPALHALKTYYRDHFFHAIEVCFLGHLLLGMEHAPGKPLIDVVKRWMRVHSRVEVLRAWYVAALFHDVGYAIDVLKSADDMLKFFECSKLLTELAKHVGTSIDTLGAALRKDAPGATDPGRDHGVVGAEHLKQLLDRIGGGTPVWPGYEQAVQAIRAHNLHSVPVSFQEQPLAFLLVLCDTIQEWNRPHLRYATAPAEMLSSLAGAGPHDGPETMGPLDRVGVNLKLAGGKPRMSEPGKLRFVLEYGQAIQKNSQVINLWLDSSSNLQRLNLDELPFNIELCFNTPKYRTPQGGSECQMHRLQQAAEETHMGFLADWFPDSPGNTAVRHQSVGDREILELDLRELTAKKRIRVDMDAVRDRLTAWRRYHEDQDFAGDYAPMNPGYPFGP
jgi:hypothetical protein